MAKPNSSDVVNDEAEAQRRFEALEENARSSKEILDRLSKKLLGEEPKPEPKPKGKPNDKPETKAGNPLVTILRNIGILAAPEASE